MPPNNTKTEKINFSDFAQQIKQKYPALRKFGDYELSKAIIMNYPQFAKDIEFGEIEKTKKELPIFIPEKTEIKTDLLGAFERPKPSLTLKRDPFTGKVIPELKPMPKRTLWDIALEKLKTALPGSSESEIAKATLINDMAKTYNVPIKEVIENEEDYVTKWVVDNLGREPDPRLKDLAKDTGMGALKLGTFAALGYAVYTNPLLTVLDLGTFLAIDKYLPPEKFIREGATDIEKKAIRVGHFLAAVIASGGLSAWGAKAAPTAAATTEIYGRQFFKTFTDKKFMVKNPTIKEILEHSGIDISKFQQWTKGVLADLKKNAEIGLKKYKFKQIYQKLVNLTIASEKDKSLPLRTQIAKAEHTLNKIKKDVAIHDSKIARELDDMMKPLEASKSEKEYYSEYLMRKLEENKEKTGAAIPPKETVQARCKKDIEEAMVMRSEQAAAERKFLEETSEALGKEGIVTPIQIQQFIKDRFSITIYGPKRKRLGKDVAAKMPLESGTIIARDVLDYEYLSHEIAHDIASKLNNVGRSLAKTARELMPYYKGTARNYNAMLDRIASKDYAKKGRFNEGFAEWLKGWLLGKKTDEKDTFTQVFFNYLIDKDRSIALNLSELKNMIRRYITQGVEDRIASYTNVGGRLVATKGIKGYTEAGKKFLRTNFEDEIISWKWIEEGVYGKGYFEEKRIPITASVYYTMTGVRNKAAAIADHMINVASVDSVGRYVGPSLKKILEPIPGEQLALFSDYLHALNALVYAKRGLRHIMPEEEALAFIQKYENSVWSHTAKEVNNWAWQFVERLAEAGGLSKNDLLRMRKANPFFIPVRTMRIPEQAAQLPSEYVAAKATGAAGKFAPSRLKARRGHNVPIEGAIESLMSYATEMLTREHRTRISQAIAELYDNSYKIAGNRYILKYFKEIYPAQVKKFHLSKLEDQLASLGFDERLLKTHKDTLLTLFTDANGYVPGTQKVISVLHKTDKGYKRRYFEIADTQLYNSLSDINGAMVREAMKVLAALPRMIRWGATQAKLAFLIKNPARDILSAIAYSKTGLGFREALTGIFKVHTAAPENVLRRFEAMGGSMSYVAGADMIAAQNAFSDLVFKKTGKRLKFINHPIKSMHAFMQWTRGVIGIPELGPRATEFKKMLEILEKERPKWTDYEKAMYAFVSGQDLTINFSRAGRVGKYVNQISAFFNANVQDISKLMRELKRNPQQVISKSLIYMTVPAVVQHLTYRNEDWYKDMDWGYKLTHWFIKVNDENITALPIPFTLGGIFISLPLAALCSMDEKEIKPIKEASKELLRGLKPPIIPNVLEIIQSIEANRTYFGTPIETEGMKRKPIEQRYKADTWEISKILSKGLVAFGVKLSPVQVQHIIKSSTGGFFEQLDFSKFSETLLARDFPLIKSLFVQSPHTPSRHIRDFFEKFTELQEKYSGKKITPKERGVLRRMRYYYTNYIRKRLKKAKEAREKGDYEKMKKYYQSVGDTIKRNRKKWGL